MLIFGCGDGTPKPPENTTPFSVFPGFRQLHIPGSGPSRPRIRQSCPHAPQCAVNPAAKARMIPSSWWPAQTACVATCSCSQPSSSMTTVGCAHLTPDQLRQQPRVSARRGFQVMLGIVAARDISAGHDERYPEVCCSRIHDGSGHGQSVVVGAHWGHIASRSVRKRQELARSHPQVKPCADCVCRDQRYLGTRPGLQADSPPTNLLTCSRAASGTFRAHARASERLVERVACTAVGLGHQVP